MKHCYTCRATEVLVRQTRYLLKDGTESGTYLCSACSIEKQRGYRATPQGHDSVIKSTQRYRDNNRDRMNAWRVGGRQPVSPNCLVCGSTGVQRHHPDYSKPAEVVPLCPLHHKQAHKALSKKEINYVSPII